MQLLHTSKQAAGTVEVTVARLPRETPRTRFLLVNMRLGFASLELSGKIVAVVLTVSSEIDVCDAQLPVVKVTS